MKKKKIILGAAFAVMSSLMVAGPASAAHCEDSDPNVTTVDFSYFGQDGREDGNPRGASACPTSAVGDPSERAPVQNR